ncbi:MAG: methyl-accepting chemotaxis protein [Polyangiaceae bacterium]
MNPRQFGVPIAILVLAVAASFIAPKSPEYVGQIFLVLGLFSAGAAGYTALSAPKGPGLGSVMSALKAAQKGKVPELPEGAPPELTAVYDEVGRLAEKNEETRERETELREENKRLARELGELKDRQRDLSSEAEKAKDKLRDVSSEADRKQRDAQAEAERQAAQARDLATALERAKIEAQAQIDRARRDAEDRAERALKDMQSQLDRALVERAQFEKKAAELAEQAGGVRIDFDMLFEDVRKAARGERVRAPNGAPPEVAGFYADLGDLSGRAQEDAAAQKQQLGVLTSVAVQIDDAVPRMSDSVDALITSTEQASTHIREVTTALNNIAASIETLASSAEESSSSILQMTATNDEVAENIGELATSVRETVSSIEEMAYSIREVAKNVDALSLTAEETSSSMNEMDVSIDQVQSNANETARLSEEVATDAEKGAEAILKTIGEIYRIKESSQEAVSVISNLGFRIEAIGQILQVIDDVAEQTNLLALNAAIIAAQAGEHGKGFAVVADEIKDLAERAGGSTKEIAELIKTIQAESKNAINAVERGAHNVDRGVEVSNEAERALKKILESSQKSTNMVRAIARATVEQAKGSKQVTDAIGRIAETVQQIAAATAEQARGSELIMKSAEKMRTITQHVERSSQEQARGGRQITTAIEQISNMVNSLNSTQRQQTRGGEQLIEIAKKIEDSARSQAQSLQRLNALTEKLRRSANG